MVKNAAAPLQTGPTVMHAHGMSTRAKVYGFAVLGFLAFWLIGPLFVRNYEAFMEKRGWDQIANNAWEYVSNSGVVSAMANWIPTGFWAGVFVVLVIWGIAEIYHAKRRRAQGQPQIVSSMASKIELAFENSPAFVTRVENPAESSTWVRIKAINRGEETAVGCRPKLIDVNKVADNGRVKPLGFSDVLELAWSNQAPTDTFAEKNLAKDIHQFIDVAYATNKENKLRSATSVAPSNPNIFRKGGTYRFTIQVVGANAKSDPFDVDVIWTGNWSHVIAIAPTAPSKAAA